MPKWFETNSESKKELEQWDVEFGSKLLRMGNVLFDEEMVQKNEEYRYFVVLFSFSKGDCAEIPYNVSGHGMEAEGAGWFFVVSRSSVKKGGCSYPCWFRMMNCLRSSCRISNRFRIKGEI